MTTDLTADIIEQGRAALIAHGLAENDGDDYVLDGVYATGAVTVILEAVAPLIAAQALESAADDLDLEDAAKASDLNDLDFDWTGRYWEAVAEHALRRRAAKLREAGR